MKGIKKFIVIAVMLLVITSLSHAFELDVNSTKLTVRAGSSAVVNITVSTNETDRFVYHINGLQTWMSVEDIGRVYSNQPKTVHMYLSPFLTTEGGVYQVTLKVESFNTGEIKEKRIFVTVTKELAVGIDKIYVKGSLKPKGIGNVSIYVKNVGTTTVSNLLVKGYVGSKTLKLMKLNETVDQIQPDETKIITREIEFPSFLKAGKYFVEAEVYYNNTLINKKVQYFDIASVHVLEKSIKTEPAFIGETIKIFVVNYGNTESKPEEVTYNLGSTNTKFFHMIKGEQPTIEDGTAKWVIPSLKPGDSYEIILQVNYLPLIVVIIIVIGALYFVAFKVKTVQIYKRIVRSHKFKNIEAYTVSIEVRNNTNKDANYIKVEDEVPMVFKIKTMTGIKPKIKKTDFATILTWRIRKMKPGDDRILSYQIIPVVGIEGGTFKLPKAKISYKMGEKEIKKQSGTSIFSL